MRTGTGWLAAAVALGAVAATLASLALFALAVGVALMVAVAAATVWLAERRVIITRTLGGREVFEDRPLRLHFGVRRLGRIPVRLEAQADDGTWTLLDGPETTVGFTIGRRGAHLLMPSPVRVSDVLGIFHREVYAGDPQPVLVLPVPDTSVHVAFPPSAAADDLDPDGLRPYVPGTPVSRIHWASLARGRELHERRLIAPPRGLPLVIVDTADAGGPGELDWVARAAAGCVLRLGRLGGCKVLLPGDTVVTEVTDTGARDEVYRRLALLDGTVEVVIPPEADGVTASVVRFPAGLTVPAPRQPPHGVEPMPRSLHGGLTAELVGELAGDPPDDPAGDLLGDQHDRRADLREESGSR